jgi:hypothetical protein
LYQQIKSDFGSCENEQDIHPSLGRCTDPRIAAIGTQQRRVFDPFDPARCPTRDVLVWSKASSNIDFSKKSSLTELFGVSSP